MLQVGVWVVLLGIFALAFYLVAGRSPAPPAASARRGGGGQATVVPATAKKGKIGVYLKSIGTVTPVYTASIVNQVTGVITAVHYREGQLVQKGDPLLDIDARQYQATMLQAQGTLEKDENVLAEAQQDLERYRAAWARNAVSKQILDDQEKLAKQNVGLVKNDQGVVQYDQVQVDYCHITAPFSGRVGLRLVDPGNLVTAGSSATPLVVVTQLQPITVIFTLPEDNLGAVQTQIGQGAKLVVDAFDRSAQAKLATGELLALDNQIDTTTGTVKVRAIFTNDDLRLFPNQFVNTRLLVQTLEGVTLVPTSAIQQNGLTSFVYLVENGVVHTRNVKRGVDDDDNGVTQVEGIAPGDVVANSSFDKIQDNDKVTLAGASGNHPGQGSADHASPAAAPAGGRHRSGGGGS